MLDSPAEICMYTPAIYHLQAFIHLRGFPSRSKNDKITSPVDLSTDVSTYRTMAGYVFFFNQARKIREIYMTVSGVSRKKLAIIHEIGPR
jgi:hypothetical protein